MENLENIKTKCNKKKCISELIYSEKYLITKKKSTQNKAFNVFMHKYID